MPTRTPRCAVYKSDPVLLLNLGSGLAVLAILAIVGLLLVRERDSVVQSSLRSAGNIVQLIESDIVRNVELYDQSLRELIWAIRQPSVLALHEAVRHRILFDRAFAKPVHGDILWIDAQGNVAGDSTSVVPRTANFADTPVFQRHRDNRDLGLLVGPPFKARLGDLDWCISFSRRISGPDGEFAGLAAGAMRLSYFSQLFQRLDIGQHSNIDLLNTDGQLLARQPARPGDPAVGTDLSQQADFKRILNEPSASFTTHPGDGQAERIHTFARVADLPLIVLVTQSSEDIFQVWQRTALLVGIATGVLCLGILWLTRLLGRELRRRHRAEQDLARLAITDSLTGLANRRQLDQVLRREWARAQRNRKPLAVLMVDVDHFKAFNQRHGHAGGDQALREVARTIEGCIRRPGDLAARYGGEEFQVVLPETELGGALLLAERIRASIEALPVFGDDSRPVTVSIGVGLHVPGRQQDLTWVRGAADAALYRAKAGGRNRVEGP